MQESLELATLQDSVNQKMGRIILRLQQYERLLKRLLATSDISVSIDSISKALTHNLDDRITEVHRKTLGQLIGEFTGNFVSIENSVSNSSEPDDAFDVPEQIHFRFKFGLELNEDRFRAIQVELTELLKMRNDLVHHFMERFDLFCESGLLEAASHLDKAGETVKRHFLELQHYASAKDQASQAMIDFHRSKEGSNWLVYGIHPDGTIDWPSAMIVSWLRNAEENCSTDGWTELVPAIEFIKNANGSDLSPQKYGRSSWRQVLHESGLFQIQKRRMSPSDPIKVWYRSKPI